MSCYKCIYKDTSMCYSCFDDDYRWFTPKSIEDFLILEDDLIEVNSKIYEVYKTKNNELCYYSSPYIYDEWIYDDYIGGIKYKDIAIDIMCITKIYRKQNDDYICIWKEEENK